MLRFTTFYTKDGHLTPDSVPHITPPADSHLVGDEVVGRNALIVGKARELAGYDIPMFFAGDIAELDSPTPQITMHLRSGEYPIAVTMDANNNYLLDLNTKTPTNSIQNSHE